MNKLLLHVCCGPDATVPLPSLRSEGFDVVGYFYGSNIHPEDEYRLRRSVVETVFSLCGDSLLFPEYDPESWDMAVRGYESLPEGGGRCSLCFREQLSCAARAAVSEGCGYLCTTLTISPHKDPVRINRIGERVARSAGLEWVPRVFRKGDGFRKSLERSGELKLYRQIWCGCRYSFRGGETRKCAETKTR
jgi:predicted adenine nucleotide alpha hydrolase (AANH) superfamily ATPase